MSLSTYDAGLAVSAEEMAKSVGQCILEDIADILGVAESDLKGNTIAGEAAQDARTRLACTIPPSEAAPLISATTSASSRCPVPPSAPPPESGSRRPGVPRVQKHEEAPASQAHEKPTTDEIVQTDSSADYGAATVNVSVLAHVLLERENEVKDLEKQFSMYQATLADKENRVAQLGSDLEKTVREVKHHQLNLEFQQLKLEQRMRANAELEQLQRVRAAQLGDAAQNGRLAELDGEICRSLPNSRSPLVAQGAIPWTLRKAGVSLTSAAAARPESHP